MLHKIQPKLCKQPKNMQDEFCTVMMM